MTVAIVTQERQVLSSKGVAMAMCHGLRMLLLLLVVLAWSMLWVDATPTSRPLGETLRQIPKLSHAQVALIAGNTTARCELTPELCDWQLHLYEGHAFSIQLPEHNNNNNSSNNSTSTTITSTTSSTTTTTSSPLVKTEPIPVIFAVPGSDQSHKLLIYAQVERQQQSWTKLAKSTTKRRRQQQQQQRQRRRRRKLLANLKTLM